MTARTYRRRCLLYPEDKAYNLWNLFIALLLIFACVYTPLDIAFSKGGAIDPIMLSVDVLFLVDIFVIFNSAFYNQDFDIIDDRGEIAKNYIKGWFFIDLIAIFPIDIIVTQYKDLNALARITRFVRMQKLVKLMRIFKIW